jgi:hypothetical protein
MEDIFITPMKIRFVLDISKAKEVDGGFEIVFNNEKRIVINKEIEYPMMCLNENDNILRDLIINLEKFKGTEGIKYIYVG